MKSRKANSLTLSILLANLLVTSSCLVALSAFHTTNVFASPGSLSGWSYRRQLTVSSALIDADLIDFPILVKLDSSFFDFSKAQDNGEDVRFTSSDGTTSLKYEIERWDSTAENAEVWVELPSVSSASDTDFYIYYGNPSASDAQDPTQVWDSNFKGVWHLNETTGGTNAIKDSTFNNNDGTDSGIPTLGTSGKIDGAIDLDGSNDYVNVGSDTSIDNIWDSGGSFSAWIQIDTISNYPRIFAKGSSVGTAGEEWSITIWTGGNNGIALEQHWSTNRGLWEMSSSIGTGVWTHLTITYNADSTSNNPTIYINGASVAIVESDTPSGTRNDDSSASGIIGAVDVPGNYFDGSIDEVRISDVVRSSAWIKATYESGRDQLLSFGSEENVPTENYVSLNSPANGATVTTKTVDFKFVATIFDGIIQNASLHVNEIDWNINHWNTTAVQSNTEHTISYTFSSEGTYVWNVEVFNSTTDSVWASSNRTITVDLPPRYQNVGSNATAILEDSAILLYGQSYDGIGFDRAWLATNETGTWKNYTEVTANYTAIIEAGDYTKYSGNPLISGKSKWATTVWKDDSIYYEFHCEGANIVKYKSTDGLSFSSNGTVLTPSDVGSWANSYLSTPMVWKENSTWYLMFRGVDTSGNVRIGLANCTDTGSPDNWTVDDDNPILSATENWEWSNRDGTGVQELENWGIMKVNSTYHLWYNNMPEGTHRSAGLATTTDTPNHWNKDSFTKDENNPIFNGEDPTDEWDNYYTAFPFKHFDTYYLLVARGLGSLKRIDVWKDTAPTFYDTSRTYLGTAINYGATYDRPETPCILTDTIYRESFVNNKFWIYYGDYDGSNLVTALANETSTSYTAENYDSPIDLNGAADAWTWSNFTWQNASISAGTTVAWRIYYEDTAGNLNATDILTFDVAASPPPIIESCNVDGAQKDTFSPGAEIYVSGSGYSTGTDYDIYVVEDVIWTNGMTIPQCVSGTVDAISSNSTGHIEPVLVWSSALPGEYDIVVDVDGDGKYSAGVDALDDLDVSSAGFFVIPEYIIGTCLALAACFVGFAVYRRSRRGEQNPAPHLVSSTFLQ